MLLNVLPKKFSECLAKTFLSVLPEIKIQNLEFCDEKLFYSLSLSSLSLSFGSSLVLDSSKKVLYKVGNHEIVENSLNSSL